MKLKFEKITKKFGGTAAVKNFSYTFEALPGRRLAICGPSGCGKSTLLSIMAGLDRDFDGSFTVTDAPAPPVISMSFQEPTLLPGLTAAQNVNIVTGDRRDGLERSRILLRELGLNGHEDDYPHELSGGMQTRVAVARALAVNADIYLFDEPFAALDPDTSRLCIEAICRRTAHASAVAVIHTPELAALFADEILTFSSISAGEYTVSRPGRE